jgi:hypothetical protein
MWGINSCVGKSHALAIWSSNLAFTSALQLPVCANALSYDYCPLVLTLRCYVVKAHFETLCALAIPRCPLRPLTHNTVCTITKTSRQPTRHYNPTATATPCSLNPLLPAYPHIRSTHHDLR